MSRSEPSAARVLPSRASEPDAASLLPQNLEAEQALLGALLHDNRLLESVSDFLQPLHFFDPFHSRVFEAIQHFSAKGLMANPITLKHYFKQDEAEEKRGEEDYLVTLAGCVVSLSNAGDYGKQIYDLYLRRELVYLGEGVVREARVHVLENDAVSQIEAAEKQLFEIATQGRTERGFQPFTQALALAIQTAETAFKRDSHVVGVTTGFVDMDKKLGGLHPSDLIIVAGRPSMGKTALATNIAFNAAQAALKGESGSGAKVAFFSLEMSAEQLALRLLGQETGIASDRIRRGAIAQTDFPKFVEVSRTLSKLPLFIDDTPGLTVAALRTRARRLQRQQGLGLIVIDYLQLMTAGRSNGDNRVQEISEITRGLKNLAKELNVPLIALSQLSRAVEQRDDKRPQLADLRESGSIEQDADVVMFVYREEYYVSRQKPGETSDKMGGWQQQMEGVHNVAEVIIAKQRHGPIGTVPLHFEGMLTKFSNLVAKEKIPHAHS